jgi:hypothetical protein
LSVKISGSSLAVYCLFMGEVSSAKNRQVGSGGRQAYRKNSVGVRLRSLLRSLLWRGITEHVFTVRLPAAPAHLPVYCGMSGTTLIRKGRAMPHNHDEYLTTRGVSLSPTAPACLSNTSPCKDVCPCACAGSPAVKTCSAIRRRRDP